MIDKRLNDIKELNVLLRCVGIRKKGLRQERVSTRSSRSVGTRKKALVSLYSGVARWGNQGGLKRGAGPREYRVRDARDVSLLSYREGGSR